MLIFNKIVLLSSLKELNYVLNNKNINALNDKNINASTCIYDTRIAIKHSIDNKFNIVRIWKTNSLFDYWFDEFSTNKFIGAIDYTINNDHIKIEYLNVNDYDSNMNSNKLTDYEAIELTNSLINFMKILAGKENKNKIIIDVHSNLHLYEKYYKDEGFVVTTRKSTDNSNWIECELILSLFDFV
jgi:hypothetical protein